MDYINTYFQTVEISTIKTKKGIMHEESPDVVYLDVVVSNINSGSSSNYSKVFAEYNEARTIPYLYNPNEYYGAIVQFTLDNTDTPLLEVQIEPDQSDANLTIYTVGLSYGASNITVPITYVPQNATAVEPLPPSAFPNGIQDLSTGYYSIFSYNYFCQLVNTAFATALTQLIALAPAIPITTNPPFIKFDPTTDLFSIEIDPIFNQTTAVTPINILMNNALYYLFYSFPVSRVAIGANTYFELIATNNTITTTLTTPSATILLQERNSTNLWDNISSICITSQTIPIVRSQTLAPGLYYEGGIIRSANNSLTQPILLEFSVLNAEYNRSITYNPTAQYKTFCLNSDPPLYNFDIKFWYRSTLGILRPIALNSGATMTLKLGFFKRSKHSHLKPLI
jgi:hypothetical protein